MAQLLYYLLLKPISLLPLALSYRLSDLLYLVLYYVVGFRKKVVYTNLRNAFPEKSPQEIRKIARRFYAHFCDLLIESVRMFSISRAEVLRRCRLVNLELVERFASQGRSIIVAAGHYNNWELAAVSFGIQASHTIVGIYKPLANPFFDRKMLQSRSRYGMEMLSKKETKTFFAANTHRLTATLFATDQSPANSHQAYWMRFLNQESGVLFGTEKYAREYNYPVVFGKIRKLRRGYYEMEFSLVEENPAQTPHGLVTQEHTRALEALIHEAPQYWLWTHKRWKKQRPEDVVLNE
ncbi:MAG: lysophospholipid acyltransferase family protein [Phaeodactylibacter sp.]|nr:lysophospholipid acyltransferase family protein [Phaeodactylibacter sp.]MCB9274379.1 lysophospholipid acyltransferase family protein [Lewinellaceae bacterium]